MYYFEQSMAACEKFLCGSKLFNTVAMNLVDGSVLPGFFCELLSWGRRYTLKISLHRELKKAFIELASDIHVAPQHVDLVRRHCAKVNSKRLCATLQVNADYGYVYIQMEEGFFNTPLTEQQLFRDVNIMVEFFNLHWKRLSELARGKITKMESFDADVLCANDPDIDPCYKETREYGDILDEDGVDYRVQLDANFHKIVDHDERDYTDEDDEELFHDDGPIHILDEYYIDDDMLDDDEYYEETMSLEEQEELEELVQEITDYISKRYEDKFVRLHTDEEQSL